MYDSSEGIVYCQGPGAWRAIRLAAAAALLGFTATAAMAQVDEREGTFEFGVQLSNVSGEQVTGNGGSYVDVSNDNAIGVVGGFNLTNRFQIGGEMTWADPAYTASRRLDPSGTTVGFSSELDIGSLLFKGTFNFLEGAFTPYVEAGYGWVQIDSNIADGPPTTGCWWDPWWGYVCTSWYETYEDTRTAYTYSVGLRWDIADEFGLRASYGITEMDAKNSPEDISLDVVRLDFFWKF
jgi:opacity protein-like surface antigen